MILFFPLSSSSFYLRQSWRHFPQNRLRVKNCCIDSHFFNAWLLFAHDTLQEPHQLLIPCVSGGLTSSDLDSSWDNKNHKMDFTFLPLLYELIRVVWQCRLIKQLLGQQCLYINTLLSASVRQKDVKRAINKRKLKTGAETTQRFFSSEIRYPSPSCQDQPGCLADHEPWANRNLDSI